MKMESVSTTEGPFAHEHAYILEHFGRDLPPVSPNVKLITVIPAYQELENHNVWRLLHAMSTQANVQSDEHEVLYVVNNNSSAVLTDRDAYKDNKQTLQLLEALTKAREAHRSGTFDEGRMKKSLQHIIPGAWEWEVFMRCVHKNVSILGINAASVLQARAQTKFGPNPRGVARNIGGHLAYERLMHTEFGERGGVDFLDGDCFPSHAYVRKILDTLRDSHAQYFSKTLHAIPSSLELGGRSPKEKLLANISYLKNMLSRRASYSLNPQPYIHGPAPVVRASTFKSVGGYPMQQMNEDFEFGAWLKQLPAKADARARIPEAIVYVQDRLRPGSVDGSLDRPGLYRGTVTEYGLGSLRPHITEAESWSIEKLLETDKKFARSPTYQQARKKAFERESLHRKVFIAGMHSTVTHIVNLTSPTHAGKGSRSESKAHPNRALFEEVIEGMSTLSDNATLLEQCSVDPQLPKEQRVWLLLEKLLPEFFALPPKAEPDYEALRHMTDRNLCNMRDLIHLSAVR